MFSTEQDPKCAHRGKRIPALLSAVVVLILLSPLLENWKAKPHDSFPLSYFPMFAARRGETYQANSLVGLDAAGNRTLLSYRLAGSGGFNQVRRQITAKLKKKRGDEICETVASKLARSRRRDLRNVETVQVVSVTHDMNKFFARGNSQVAEKVYASCAVPREQSIAKHAREVQP